MENLRQMIQSVGARREPQWDKEYPYIWELLALQVGLGNVWRFPFLVLEHGGSSFLLVYIVSQLLLGIPMVTLELALGQFTSCSITNCWHFSRLFKGVGLAQCLYTIVGFGRYPVIIAWILTYLGRSFMTTHPWTSCHASFATDLCLDYVPVTSAQTCLADGLQQGEDGACYNTSITPKRISALWNYTLARQRGIKRRLPSLDYMDFVALGTGKKDVSVENLGDIQWSVLLSLCVSSVLACVCVSFGLRTINQYVSRVMILVFTLLFVLTCFACSLQGSSDGIELLFRGDMSKLGQLSTWMVGVVHVIFDLNIGGGLLVSLASFSRFRNDVCLHAVLGSVVNIVVSIVASVMIFAFVGFLAFSLDADMEEFAMGRGHDLSFAIVPYTVHLAVGQYVSHILLVSYFFTIFLLALTTEIYWLLLTLSNVCDVFLELRYRRLTFLLMFSAVLLLLEIPLTTQGGSGLMDIIATYISTYDVFLLIYLEVMALVWVYGFRQFLRDIESMVGDHIFWRLSVPFSRYKWFLAFTWTFICPVALVSLTFGAIVKFNEKQAFHSTWDKIFGTFIGVAVLIPIPIAVLWQLFKKQDDAGQSLTQRLKALVLPSESWGPSLLKDWRMWLNRLQSNELRNVCRSTMNPLPGAPYGESSVSMKRYRKATISSFFDTDLVLSPSVPEMGESMIGNHRCSDTAAGDTKS